MIVDRVQVRLTSTPGQLDLSVLIPVFHRWIQHGVLSQILPIDVADYRHVEQGPGILLIGHHAHLSVEAASDRTALVFAYKRTAPGPAKTHIASALDSALEAALRLAQEPTVKLELDTSSVEVSVLNRLLAPNTDASYAALADTLKALAADWYAPQTVEISRTTQTPQPLAARLRVPTPVPVAALRTQLEQSLAA